MNKLLVVGLDGATFDLILPWAAQGRLPLFARWLAAGAHGRCRSVPNTDTAPAWATFATGLSPANHGLFGEWRWSADRHTLQPAQGADRHGAAFWELAAAAGRRVLVVNVPFTYPAAPLDGVLLTGIDAPGADAPGFCHPPDFLRAVPGYRIDSHIQAAIKENRPEAGLADAYAVEARRTDALLHAMRLGAWHVAAIVYSVPDVMQHFFWHQMAQDSGPQRHAILDSHTFIEGEIARLLAAAGPDTNLVLLSDHGFGPICATRESLAAWLAAHGWTALLDPARQPWRQRVVRAAYGRLRHALGEAQKEALRRRLPAVRSRVESDVRFAGIDWRRTRAFAGASSWEIWINRQGREPHGIVRAADYPAVLDELAAALLAWQDEAGRPRVQAVQRAGEAYHGRFQHLAPDLTITWNPAAAPDAAALPGNASRFSGDHQPEGIFVAVGPDVHAQGELHGVQLQDVAPTLLRLAGLPVPGGLDGRALLPAG